MKVTRVQYSVRSDFVEENKRNIEAVMSELRALSDNDVHYAAYLHDDGKTFMHLVHHKTADAERLPASLDSFNHFRTRLSAHLEVTPKVETFALTQSSVPIF
jgi:hypothetical protein